MIIRKIQVNDDDRNDAEEPRDDDEGSRLSMTQQQRLLPASISRSPRDFPLSMFCYFSITVIHFSVSSASAFSPNPSCVSLPHWCLSSVAHYSDFYWFVAWLFFLPPRSKQCVNEALVCCQKKLFKEHVHDFIVALHSYIM